MFETTCVHVFLSSKSFGATQPHKCQAFGPLHVEFGRVLVATTPACQACRSVSWPSWTRSHPLPKQHSLEDAFFQNLCMLDLWLIKTIRLLLRCCRQWKGTGFPLLGCLESPAGNNCSITIDNKPTPLFPTIMAP